MSSLLLSPLELRLMASVTPPLHYANKYSNTIFYQFPFSAGQRAPRRSPEKPPELGLGDAVGAVPALHQALSIDDLDDAALGRDESSCFEEVERDRDPRSTHGKHQAQEFVGDPQLVAVATVM